VRLVRISTLGGQASLLSDFRLDLSPRLPETQDARQQFWRQSRFFYASPTELPGAQTRLPCERVERHAATAALQGANGLLDGRSSHVDRETITQESPAARKGFRIGQLLAKLTRSRAPEALEVDDFIDYLAGTDTQTRRTHGSAEAHT
jgi:hypothetical protein